MAEAACRQSGQGMWYDMAVRLHARINAAKKLIPNVDFYSAPLFYAIGIPVDLFTPVIAAARIAGWTANLLEQYDDNRLIRPRADYKGPARRAFSRLANVSSPCVRVGESGARGRPPTGERGPFEAPADGKQARMNLTQKLVQAHLVSGKPVAGEEIGLRVDQCLLTDTNGSMAWLQFEAMDYPRVIPKVVVTYIDHNVYQTDSRNTDDHRYLQTAARRYGSWFSKPGNGICHQVHFETFSVPGQFVLGTDSHTPLCGSTGMLAIGAGGLDVAVAMGGGAYHLPMPKVVRVWLTGELPPWVHAKDVILELLRRYSVRGGSGKIFEYGGPGAATLSLPQRATICNMGAELTLTTSVFPSDEATRAYFALLGREADWRPLAADPDAEYDEQIELDLSALVPLVALPASPDKVVPVSEVEGTALEQVMVGSCTNSSWEDMWAVAPDHPRRARVGGGVLRGLPRQ